MYASTRTDRSCAWRKYRGEVDFKHVIVIVIHGENSGLKVQVTAHIEFFSNEDSDNFMRTVYDLSRSF